MRTYDISLVTLHEQPAAVVRAHVTADQIASFVGGAFGEVAQVAARRGTQVTGTPFARYHLTAEGFDIEAGFPVGAAVTEGRVETTTLPGGRAVRILHRGSYAEVGAAYEAGREWMAEHGYEPASDPWETYLDEPDVAEPRTEVLMPCQRTPSGGEAALHDA